MPRSLISSLFAHIRESMLHLSSTVLSPHGRAGIGCVNLCLVLFLCHCQTCYYSHVILLGQDDTGWTTLGLLWQC